jgi:2-polyprenyl-3-methyl-5-hydroxy-6-metoxy-1,4-benzoquinol methylase
MIEKEKVKSFFDNTELYLFQNAIIPIRKEILQNYLNSITNKNIIDIGCGDASVTSFLSENNRVTYLDMSDEMLQKAKKNIQSNLTNTTFINADIETLPSENTFDFVISIGLLAHVNDVTFTIKRLVELLNDNGVLVLQFTNANNILSIIIRLKNFILDKKMRYKSNLTRYKNIKVICSSFGLKKVKRIQYWAVFPGLNVLKYNCKIKFLRFLYRIFPFSFLGGENIVVFRKRQ